MAKIVNEITFPLRVVLKSERSDLEFESLEDAGLYIEWMNARDSDFSPHSDSWKEAVVLDAAGRELWLHIEYRTVLDVRFKDDMSAAPFQAGEPPRGAS